MQTGCRARDSAPAPPAVGEHWGEEQAWRHSSSLQGGKDNAKHVSTLLGGQKSLHKGPNADSPCSTWQNSPGRLLGQLAPRQDTAAAGTLKPLTAPLQHRKLSNRLTKGLLITSWEVGN